MSSPQEPPSTAAQQDSQPVSETATNVFERFYDFDKKESYQQYVEQATGALATNFAVRFNVETSKIAIGLDESDVKVLLDRQTETDEVVTWINLWSRPNNINIVKTIAKEYQFSTRLLDTILGWDEARRVTRARRERAAQEQAAKARVVPDDATDRMQQKPRRRGRYLQDPEKGVSDGNEANISIKKSIVQKLQFHQEDLDLYELLQDQYNYTTIDHGEKFICIGANWLHHRPQGQEKKEHVQDTIYTDKAGLTPPKHWAWYILTSDGTVISIHETPNYELPKDEKVDEDKWKRDELINMRKNTRDLLNQLSFHGMQAYQNRFSSQKGVRSDRLDLKSGGSQPRARATIKEESLAVDAPANLFFYLFEDYTAAIAILPKAGDILAKLTHDVLHITDRKNRDKDNSNIIRVIYARGKELRQLKHLFLSYEKLIASIMKLGTDKSRDMETAATTPRVVKLSQTAYDRFERLSVRMRLLMLDTIDEALAEKASLSDTYFNLVSQNDSQATSKLNKNASLLAKLSVFFLPISFMTSYFSIQIPELTNGYTSKTYWVSFAVIAALSFLSLFFFSRMLMHIGDYLHEKMEAFQDLVGNGFLWVASKLSKIWPRTTYTTQANATGKGHDDDDDGNVSVS